MQITKSELKYLRSLSQKKVREREGKFFLEGWRSIQEAIAGSARIDLAAVLPGHDGHALQRNVLTGLRRKRIPIKEISERELASLSSTMHAQGIIAVVHHESHRLEDVLGKGGGLFVALDALSDPGNLGTIIRTCDWFGVDGLFVGKGSVEVHNEKVVRATAGSIFHLPIVEQVDLVQAAHHFKRNAGAVVAFSGDASKEYTAARTNKPTLLLFGTEAHGLSHSLIAVADEVLRIPRFGRGESLNVGVACGIALAHVRSSHAGD
jgi:TrmH family RNA methyltransferase